MWRLGANAVAIVVLAAIFPAGASAGAHANERHSPGQSAALTVAGSNGYSIYLKSENGLLSMVVSRGRPGVATISPRGRLVARDSGDVAWTTYMAPVAEDPGTIEADLGALGKVSLSFQPSGEKTITKVDLEDKSEKCIGAAKIVRRLGVFTGTLSFHGEDGYTSVDTTSAPGSVGTSTFRNCTTLPGAAARASSPPAGQQRAADLVAGSGSVSVALFAFTDSTGSRFSAFSGKQPTPRLSIIRQASAVAPSSSFRFDPSLDNATLQPPAPFSGFAAFRDPPRRPAYLKGTLAVKFPGLVASLVGPDIGAPKLRLLPAEP